MSCDTQQPNELKEMHNSINYFIIFVKLVELQNQSESTCFLMQHINKPSINPGKFKNYLSLLL